MTKQPRSWLASVEFKNDKFHFLSNSRGPNWFMLYASQNNRAHSIIWMNQMWMNEWMNESNRNKCDAKCFLMLFNSLWNRRYQTGKLNGTGLSLFDSARLFGFSFLASSFEMNERNDMRVNYMNWWKYRKKWISWYLFLHRNENRSRLLSAICNIFLKIGEKSKIPFEVIQFSKSKQSFVLFVYVCLFWRSKQFIDIKLFFCREFLSLSSHSYTSSIKNHHGHTSYECPLYFNNVQSLFISLSQYWTVWCCFLFLFFSFFCALHSRKSSIHLCYRKNKDRF